MKPPANDNQADAIRRAEFEGRYTRWRIKELEANPVAGKFDAAHLKEVNRRIFQDLPRAGFDNVTPGEFRKPVPDDLDWMKARGLFTVDGSFYIAYSRMDAVATARLDNVLEEAKPEKLRGLKTPEFTARLANIYAEIDYIHPFRDGNSRTLRTFTKQLAKEAGYEIDWDRFGRSYAGRDVLYIARDLSVMELAIPHIQNDSSLRNVLYTKDRLEGNRDLPDLLRDAVRPSRAVAFEQLSEQEALKKHPDLEEAYKTMRTAANYFAAKMPGNPDAQEAGIQSVMNHVQSRLNAGETSNFSKGREPAKIKGKMAVQTNEKQTEQPAPDVGLER
jgi:cell filamentation protein